MRDRLRLLAAAALLVTAFALPPLHFAFTAWLLPGDRVLVVPVAQARYAPWRDGGAVGPAPGQPSSEAVFLMSAGGLTHARPSAWAYAFEQAEDPIDGTSVVHRLSVVGDGWRGTATRSRFSIPNHHSVTFDATSSGSLTDNASDCTAAHTVANQSNVYIAGLGGGRNLSPTTTKYNAVDLTARLTASQPGSRAYLWDLVAPTHDGASHNLVFNYSGTTTTQVCGGISAYGVDQTTPRSNTKTSTNTSNAPSDTVTSATGELVISVVSWVNNVANTIDASFTSDWNTSTAGSFPRGSAGAHKAGAATVTRTDALASSQDWNIAMASLKAASAGGATPPTLTLLGAGPGQ